MVFSHVSGTRIKLKNITKMAANVSYTKIVMWDA